MRRGVLAGPQRGRLPALLVERRDDDGVGWQLAAAVEAKRQPLRVRHGDPQRRPLVAEEGVRRGHPHLLIIMLSV